MRKLEDALIRWFALLIPITLAGCAWVPTGAGTSGAVTGSRIDVHVVVGRALTTQAQTGVPATAVDEVRLAVVKATAATFDPAAAGFSAVHQGSAQWGPGRLAASEDQSWQGRANTLSFFHLPADDYVIVGQALSGGKNVTKGGYSMLQPDGNEARVTVRPDGVVSPGRVTLQLPLLDGVPRAVPLGPFAVGNTPTALLADGDGVWVAVRESDRMIKVAPDGRFLETVVLEPGFAPDILGKVNGLVGVGSTSHRRFYFYAANHYETVGRARPAAAAVDSRNYAWLVSGESDLLMRFDASFREIVPPLVAGSKPVAVAIGAAGRAWLVNRDSGDVYRYAPDGHSVGDPIPVGNAPTAIAIGADGHAWVTLSADHRVARIAPDGTVLGTYPVGQRPMAVAVDSTGHAWVASTDSHEVHRVSPGGAVTGPYPVGQSPAAIVVDRDDRVWVANRDGGSVQIVSPR